MTDFFDFPQEGYGPPPEGTIRVELTIKVFDALAHEKPGKCVYGTVNGHKVRAVWFYRKLTEADKDKGLDTPKK